MQTTAVVGIIAVIAVVIVIAAVALLATGKPSSTATTTTLGSTTASSHSATNSSVSQGITSTGISYLAKSAAAAGPGNSTLSVTLPTSQSGQFVCIEASDYGGASLFGPASMAQSIQNICNTTTGGVLIGLGVYNFTASSTNPASYPPFGYQAGFNSEVYNYTVSYPNSLALTVAACQAGACSLSVPSGCTMAQSLIEGNNTVYLVSCINQPAGTYQETLNFNSSEVMGTYVFH